MIIKFKISYLINQFDIMNLEAFISSKSDSLKILYYIWIDSHLCYGENNKKDKETIKNIIDRLLKLTDEIGYQLKVSKLDEYIKINQSRELLLEKEFLKECSENNNIQNKLKTEIGNIQVSEGEEAFRMVIKLCNIIFICLGENVPYWQS